MHSLVYKLVEAYKEKLKLNPRYSQRAFARDIGIPQSQLMRILKNKRRVTPLYAYKISVYLKLSRDEMLDALIESVLHTTE